MKLARLFQPRNPLFWLMIAFNLLSSALAWALRAWPLTAVASAVIGIFALINALIGLGLAWRLVNAPDVD